MKDKEKIIKEMFERGVLVSEDFLDNDNFNNEMEDKLSSEEDLLVLNSDYAQVIIEQNNLIDWNELDKHRVDLEKERNDDLYQTQLQQLKTSSFTVNNDTNNLQNINSLESELDVQKQETNLITNLNLEDDKESEAELILKNKENASEFQDIIRSPVSVVISYNNIPHKYTVKDFSQIFLSRYRFLESLLRNRQELNNTLSINRILNKKEKEKVSAIGLVQNIGITKNGNVMITLEDPTGLIKVFFSNKNKDLFGDSKDLVNDEVIGVSGTSGDKIIFADNLIWPDIPTNNDLKKTECDDSAIFLSDVHYGSKVFLEEEFNKFIKWINGKTGNEKQRELAGKVKYIFIAGDLVDGIGIYPTHEKDLKYPDIYEQYEGFTNLIKQIPSDKNIIMCPGNHDLVHLAEPQNVIYEEYAKSLFQLPNVTLVTNPALINIGKTENFSGFDVLMYHGYSFDYYVSNVESIRNNGGYHRADLIMKFLLKRRHLAPTFGSTPYFPAHKEDPLLIQKIPDFFITGHIHYSKVANYKGVTMICGSCWQGKTDFQEKLGHEPEPARVPIVNLKTREVKILKFI
jgi:DNA polymerase II small subunit